CLAGEISDQPEPIGVFLARVVIDTPTLALMRRLKLHSLHEVGCVGRVDQRLKPRYFVLKFAAMLLQFDVGTPFGRGLTRLIWHDSHRLASSLSAAHRMC